MRSSLGPSGIKVGPHLQVMNQDLLICLLRVEEIWDGQKVNITISYGHMTNYKKGL